MNKQEVSLRNSHPAALAARIFGDASEAYPASIVAQGLEIAARLQTEGIDGSPLSLATALITNEAKIRGLIHRAQTIPHPRHKYLTDSDMKGIIITDFSVAQGFYAIWKEIPPGYVKTVLEANQKLGKNLTLYEEFARNLLGDELRSRYLLGFIKTHKKLEKIAGIEITDAPDYR